MITPTNLNPPNFSKESSLTFGLSGKMGCRAGVVGVDFASFCDVTGLDDFDLEGTGMRLLVDLSEELLLVLVVASAESNF